MKKICLTLLAGLLYGCTPKFSSNIISFYDEDELEKGKSFFILPYEHQEGSLEYKKYASTISSELERAGYEPVKNKDKADYKVYFDYGIEGSETEVRTSPLYGSVGFLGSYNNSRFFPGFGISNHRVYSDTKFTKILVLDIIDSEKSTKGNKVKVFEGKVRNTSSAESFAEVSECLITVLFKEFPGENGKPVNISIPYEECKGE